MRGMTRIPVRRWQGWALCYIVTHAQPEQADDSPMASVLQATKSAAKPSAIWPMSSRPRFLAPPWMAICSAFRQLTAPKHTAHQSLMHISV